MKQLFILSVFFFSSVILYAQSYEITPSMFTSRKNADGEQIYLYKSGFAQGYLGITSTLFGNNAVSLGGNRIEFQTNGIGIGGFSNEGNFGIGETFPGYKLHIKTESSDPIMHLRTTSDSIRIMYINPTIGPAFENVVRFTGGTNSYVKWSNNNVPLFRITADGSTITEKNTTTKGYTKLGTDAPAIKVKKMTGLTASTEGGFVSLAHGLNAANILSVTVMVSWNTNQYICNSYTFSPGFEFNHQFDATNIVVSNVPGNSANILSSLMKIMITYED